MLLLQQKLQPFADADIDWKALVMVFSTMVYGLETYLTLRQFSMYKKKSPPDALAHKFTPDVFEKSQTYGRDKAIFSLWSSAYDQALELLLLHFDAQAWAWTVAGNFLVKRGYGDWEILHSVLWLGILLLLGGIPSLPVQYYQTFVLEQKHGFNKSSIGLFVSDVAKGWVLAAAIGGPFIAAFLWIIKWAGDGFIPWLMAFMVAFQLIMVVLYPLVIQPLFNKLSPLPEDSPLRARVEKLALSLQFPLKDLYVIDGSKRSAHSNAYFYGLPWSKHIVIYDTLINQSTPEEIEAVLAHELGHWSFSHPMKMMIISQLHLLLILSACPPFLASRPLVKSFGFPSGVYNRPLGKAPPTIVSFMLFQMILTPVESLFKLFLNALSRQFEWEADQFALKIGTSPSDVKVEPVEVNGEIKTGDLDDMGARLARALITLHVENLSTVWVDWLYSAYHHSHPTLTERLKAMDDFRAKKQASAAAKSKKEL
ncbi:hypothetical protein DL93DRAFT_2051713 [Clavulina sp. PMI_390]|nr:hypothetical protein DL93DRAFT_2051713 [Clavulina sp. PMI_390]